MNKFLVASVIFLSATSQAIETDKAAHLGIAHLSTMGMYGAFKSIGVEKNWSLVYAACLVGMASTLSEMSDRKFDGGDLAHNFIGIGSAVGFTLVFDF